MIPIDEWTPDLPPLEGGATRAVNALPRGNGYAPFYGPVVYTTNALDAYPRGLVTGRSRTDALYTYAATATKIYEMSGAEFTDVTRSSGGDYTSTQRQPRPRYPHKMRSRSVADLITDDHAGQYPGKTIMEALAEFRESEALRAQQRGQHRARNGFW